VKVTRSPSGRVPIFVGDIQGCGSEFVELLERAKNRFGDEFELHAVGDLINRGPKNLLVLERMRGLVDEGRATFVLGNHELALIRIHFGLRTLQPPDTFGEVLESKEADDWIEWLRRRPVSECGELDGQPWAMVHASVHPEWTLDRLRDRSRAIERLLGSKDEDDAVDLLSVPREELEPESPADQLGRLVSCRSVTEGGWSSAAPAAPEDAWHSHWLERGHDYGVVYGHWAMQGLHVVKGLRGLDTGCVHHGRGRDGFLSAWLPGLRDRKGKSGRGLFDVPDDRLWQIKARRRYYFPD
jgi:bis(5'-nucleosyl)-tetraphosphatase (symmetrical)